MKNIRIVVIFIMLALVLIACQEEDPTATPLPQSGVGG